MLKNKSFRFGAFAAALMLLIAPSFAASTYAAEAETSLVQSEAAGSVDITVYGNRYAQIQETRTVELSAGTNRIQLNDIAAQYIPDSLRLIETSGAGDFTYGSATYQPANLNTNEILNRSIGKTVTATVGHGDSTKDVTGTLNAVNGSRIILTGTDGKTYLAASSNVVVDEMPAGLSNTASLVVEANASQAGTYEITFLYETSGVGWSAKHSIIYDEEESLLKSFETTVNVVNNSGTTFENATLWLLSGDVPQAERSRGGPRYDVAMSAGAEKASVESVGERKVYRLPGTVDLVSGQSRQVPLYSASDVPADKEFFVSSGDYRLQNGTLAPVNVQLNMKNCAESNLGHPLPAATVKIYQSNSEGNLQLTATTHVGELAIDESFSLSMGTSSDVKGKLTLKDSTKVVSTTPVQPGQRAPEWQDRLYEVELHNFKTDEDVDVTVRVSHSADQDLGAPFTEESATLSTTSVTVAKGGKEAVQYTLRVRTR